MWDCSAARIWLTRGDPPTCRCQDLLDQMIDELGSILGGLEDENCAKAYEFLKKRLNESFLFLAIHADELESRATGFKTSFWEEPSKVMALVQVRMGAKVWISSSIPRDGPCQPLWVEIFLA